MKVSQKPQNSVKYKPGNCPNELIRVGTRAKKAYTTKLDRKQRPLMERGKQLKGYQTNWTDRAHLGAQIDADCMGIPCRMQIRIRSYWSDEQKTKQFNESTLIGSKARLIELRCPYFLNRGKPVSDNQKYPQLLGKMATFYVIKTLRFSTCPITGKGEIPKKQGQLKPTLPLTTMMCSL